MSAKFEDGLLGYGYFIEKNGSISLEDVNILLIKNNRNPISERTYRHYRSLMRYGFRRYFPINQFDVSKMLGQLPVAPDRRRYDREIADIETAISSDGITWISGRIVNISMIGFGMTTTDELTMKDNDPILG